MSERRFIIEMGTGNSQQGRDYTRAAGRAIEDAIRQAQLSILSALGIDDREMRVQVTVGVQKPEAVDCDALVKLLPRGRHGAEAGAQHERSRFRLAAGRWWYLEAETAGSGIP